VDCLDAERRLLNKLRLTYFSEEGHPEYIGTRAIVSGTMWSPNSEKIAATVVYESVWGTESEDCSDRT